MSKEGRLTRVRFGWHKLRERNVAVLVFLVVSVGGLGIWLAGASFADVFSSMAETEDGTVAGPAEMTADNNASNGHAVLFKAADSSDGDPGGGGTGGSGQTINVTTSVQLTAALAAANPGDTIHVADGNYTGSSRVGNYTGSFTMTKSGTASQPITLTGSRNVMIDGDGLGGHYGLYIVGASYWNITGISVTNATKGIVMDGGNHITLSSIRVFNIGQEGVHFRASSSDNVIKNSVVEQTGIKQAQYGEGVYIGSANSNWATYSNGQPDKSDRNKVLNNTIGNTGAENIDIKEGSTDGVVDGNHFDGVHMKGENSADSWIDVKGNNYTISNNIGVVSSSEGTVFNNGFELHQAVVGWGINNKFHNNSINLANSTGGSVKTTGFGFYQQKGLTGNILSCDNNVQNAPQGFGVFNVTAQPCNDQ
jgi:uncharacterized protein with FMN-binding domain